MKPKYKFSHKGRDGRYYWYGVRPIDSRYEEVSCSAAWFWNRSIPVSPFLRNTGKW